jgi:hypothetical protein
MYIEYSARDLSKLTISAESPALGEAEVGRLKRIIGVSSFSGFNKIGLVF